MVRIPEPAQQGQPVGSVQQSGAATPFINARAADLTQPGRDLMQIGQGLGQMANILQQRQNDVALREAEAEFMAYERQLLDPQTGVFTRRQGNAVGVTQQVASDLGKFRDDLLTRYGERVSASGRSALEQYLQGAEQRMWGRVASHELREAEAYEESLILGGIGAQTDRAAALYNMPDEIAASVFQVEALAGDLADSRGLTGPAREQFISAQTTQVHATVAQQMAAAGDSTKAYAYIEQLVTDGAIDQTEGRALLMRLRPMMVEQEASRAAALALQADTEGGVVVPGLSYTPGPSNPPTPSSAAPGNAPITGVRGNPSMQPLFTLQGASSKTSPNAERNMRALLEGPFMQLQNAMGVQLTINDAIAKSGTSRERETPGSQHFHGNALDIDISRMSPADQRRLVDEALKAGFTGFGFGRGILHIDMGPRRSWSYGNTSYAGVPVGNLQQKVAAFDLSAVTNIQDVSSAGAPAPAGTGGITSEPLVGSLAASDITAAIDRGAAGTPAAAAGAPPEGTRYTSSADYLDSITDPEIRAAALDKLADLRKQQDALFTADQKRLTNELYTMMEDGAVNGQPFNLDEFFRQNPDAMWQLGDNIKGIREYAQKRASGEDIVTDPGRIETLRSLAVQDPEQFAQLDFAELRATGMLSGPHFEELSKKKAAILEKTSTGLGYTPSEITDLLSSVTRGMPTEDRAVVERAALDYVTSYMQQSPEKRPPTETELLAFAQRTSAPYMKGSIDPSGMLNRTSGTFNEIMAAASSMSLPDFMGSDVTLPVPMRDGSVREVALTEDRMREIVNMFLGIGPNGLPDPDADALGRAPTPTELINMFVLLESDLL